MSSQIHTRKMTRDDMDAVIAMAGYMHKLSPLYQDFEFSAEEFALSLTIAMTHQDYMVCVSTRGTEPSAEITGIIIAHKYQKVFSPDYESMDQGLFTPYPGEGIGSALLAAYVQWAKANEVKRILVLEQSGIHYPHMREKFETCGFKHSGDLYAFGGC